MAEETIQTSESFNDVALETFKDLAGSVIETKNFVLNQAPEVIQQYLNWCVISNTIDVCLGLILIIGLLLVWKWGINKLKSMHNNLYDRHYNAYDKCDNRFVMIGINVILVIVLFPIFVETIFSIVEIVKVCVAPKLVLIEAISHVVKHGTLP